MNLFTETLLLAKTFVISDKIPCSSLTSNLRYTENFLLFKFSKVESFLFFSDKTKGNLTLPLNIEHISEINEDVVGPGPAPSPCSTVFPTGVDSTITAFRTPSIFAI